MRSAAVSISREGVAVVLEACLPGRAPQSAGVLLVDPATGRGWVRMRRSFEGLAEPEDAEVLDALAAELPARVAEEGGAAFLASVEDALSNALRVGERRTVAVDAFTRVLDRLYGEYVEPVHAVPFTTHLPLYSLRAAAGGLGEEMQSAAEDWVPAPEGLHPAPDMFVAHVVGKSMEPRIPDGSLNLFRLHPHGSRQNRILLIERFGTLDETARYTVKRYTSRKVHRGEDEWEHERIRLEPLNHDFEGWDVGPEDFAVVAEWLRVIE